MKKSNTGFALIEVIVAIVVLAGTLTGAMSLVWTASNAVIVNQNRLTATYLAQECLEMARNTRDSAWRQSLPWDCAWESSVITECDDLKSNIESMLMGEEGVVILGEATKFDRKMSASVPSTIYEAINIECKVSWDKSSGSDSVIINEILTNWRKK